MFGNNYNNDTFLDPYYGSKIHFEDNGVVRYESFYDDGPRIDEF